MSYSLFQYIQRKKKHDTVHGNAEKVGPQPHMLPWGEGGGGGEKARTRNRYQELYKIAIAVPNR